jgi:cation transport ATPase
MPIKSNAPEVLQLLDRPAIERVRESRYRLGQAVVFGLPVLGLQYWGPSLGGSEAARWVGIMQVLLCGWVMYVAAFGAILEGTFRLAHGRVGIGLLLGLIALGMYVSSLVAVLYVLFEGRIGDVPRLFHWSIVLVIAWSAMSWAWWERAAKRGAK